MHMEPRTPKPCKRADDVSLETPRRSPRFSSQNLDNVRDSPPAMENYHVHVQESGRGQICSRSKGKLLPGDGRKTATRKEIVCSRRESEIDISPLTPKKELERVKACRNSKDKSPGTRRTIKTRKEPAYYERLIVTSAVISEKVGVRKRKRGRERNKKTYFRKVEYDGAVFEVEDNVYVKRREDASSDDEDPEVEECKICFKSDYALMIECGDCLGGFHLKCLKPPLKAVPRGDWNCPYCEGKRSGKVVDLPTPLDGKKRARSCREKLLSCDLYAARIKSLWKDAGGSYWFRARWYMIPEETAAGRQPNNLRRELYRTNDFADVEMECILRHCYVMDPEEYANAENEGDDVFMCEYEYDINWHTFKRIIDIEDIKEHEANASDDDDWTYSRNSDLSSDDDTEAENIRQLWRKPSTTRVYAANAKKGHSFELKKIGTKKIPDHVRGHKESEIERTKAMLLMSTLPMSLPCRQKEIEDITSFLKSSICGNQCLGHFLYIHGVPGTGKTMSVLSVIRNLRAEVDRGSLRPFRFVEINGLKLSSPESIYRVIYEALTEDRLIGKKALQLLNERFSEGKKLGKEDDRPCILLIDELDLLVTRSQSVLYNVLDWPTKPQANLIVIGIANTMDLPEKLLPRITSRMGIQRLCFGPYNHQQLQEIISSRLKGVDTFKSQAIEFASRKVAAISGDARRALELCRRAAEIADYRQKNSSSNSIQSEIDTVGMPEVEAAIQEMFQAPHIQIIKSLSRVGKILLTAMVYDLYKSGMTETTFEKLVYTVSKLCAGNKEGFPGCDELLKVGCRLGESKLIICESGAKHRMQKLQLNFPSEDVAFALKDCKELTWVSKYI